jgi:hypothetical protein
MACPVQDIVAHQLAMTNTQGDPQAAQLLKLLHEFKSLSVMIDIGQFIAEEVGIG